MANDSLDVLESLVPTAKLATQTLTRGVDTVHQEEMVIGDGVTDGRIATVTAANALKVDNSAVTQPISDAAGSLTVDALDLDIRNLAHGSDSVRLGDGTDLTLVTAAGELNVLASAQPGVDIGDVTVNNGAGAAAVNIQDGGNSITVDGTVTSNVGTGTRPVAGDVAHDAVDSGNPVKIGAKASGALPTAVAALDRTDAYFDREGRQIVRPWGAGEWSQVHLPAVNVRATSTKAAGAAGIRHVCTGITVILAGDSTAPAATVLDVRLRDGIADTGTILWQAKINLPAVAGAMNGIARSGLHIKGTAATAMTLEFSAAGGANTFESVSFEGVDITEA